MKCFGLYPKREYSGRSPNLLEYRDNNDSIILTFPINVNIPPYNYTEYQVEFYPDCNN